MILCICDYGEVRSVAMRNVLRRRGYCANSIGINEEYKDIKQYIMDAKPTKIIWMSNGSHITDGFIGKDIWGTPNNKKLIKLCEDKADELGFKDKRLNK